MEKMQGLGWSPQPHPAINTKENQSIVVQKSPEYLCLFSLYLRGQQEESFQLRHRKKVNFQQWISPNVKEMVETVN